MSLSFETAGYTRKQGGHHIWQKKGWDPKNHGGLLLKMDGCYHCGCFQILHCQSSSLQLPSITVSCQLIMAVFTLQKLKLPETTLTCLKTTLMSSIKTEEKTDNFLKF